MAEIKNNFTSSKMNQDIDDRLMPNNEYRYALNLEVNRSEASDVGTLQNILGNSLAVDFNSIANTSGLECIGVYVDESHDNIYVFLTNYSGSNYSTTAKNYIYVYNNKQAISPSFNPALLVSGAWLNFSTKFPIYGINLIENLLFWTDNRNQPRKINVQRATNSPGYYTTEEQISVAKLSPLHAPELYKLRGQTPYEYETTMYDVVSLTLPDGTPNPYLQTEWPGDPAYLESRYVRFSYRYKFDDGEYSIMAPFTQIAYIPKQDGFFMYEAPAVPGGEPVKDDESSAYRSTIVDFMQNKVNDILLQIILPYKGDNTPCPANEVYSRFKIVEIEILYKEADGLPVSAVDSIPTIPDSSKGNSYFWNTTEVIYSYNYQSKKPFKTLPSRDLIRVNDIVPVKALSQEIVGNRVVYGNYQDKYTYPKYLDYNVGASEKASFGFEQGEGTSVIEYPNHSLKENRNYQVGIVFGDRFGRESGVILSDKITSTLSESSIFGASSLYLPYTSENEIIPYDWTGNSLKILFNQPISPDTPDSITKWPGIYNGDKNSPNYNPLGWYSYKIVVKQTEQDYYNVYLPGTMAAYPGDSSLELGKTSHIVLLNDNINKIPRDLSEVGPNQKQFRSSVVLYPRVNNNTLAYHNEQYYPGNTYSFVNTIATNNSLFFADGIIPNPVPTVFNNFYQINSDPLIARVSTYNELGVPSSVSSIAAINLSIFETKPVESKLDIYWETSTSGLISELNKAISEGTTVSVSSLYGWSFSLFEDAAPGAVATAPFVFKDVLGAEIDPDNVVLQSVLTLSGANISDKFVLEKITGTNSYVIKTAPNKYFYYGYDGNTAQSYIFNIRATAGSPAVSKNFSQTGSLGNLSPSITNAPTEVINKETGDINIYQFTGVNGSNPAGGNSTAGLTWSIYSAVGYPFEITQNGLLKDPTGQAQGEYIIEVILTEASGESTNAFIEVIYPPTSGIIFSSPTSGGPASGYYYYTGTVQIIGSNAIIQLYADLLNGEGVVTNFSIDGENYTVDNYYDPYIRNYGPTIELPPGNYAYTLGVTVTGLHQNSGNGGLLYYQL